MVAAQGWKRLLASEMGVCEPYMLIARTALGSGILYCALSQQ